MSSDLRSCPYCGADAERVGAAVRCRPCGVSVTPRWDSLPKRTSSDERVAAGAAEAAARWNRRPTPRDDLLARCHAHLAELLRADIESFAPMIRVDGEAQPKPLSLTRRDEVEFVQPTLALVRDIETALGGIAEMDGPQWLRDVIDGRLRLWAEDHDGATP